MGEAHRIFDLPCDRKGPGQARVVTPNPEIKRKLREPYRYDPCHWLAASIQLSNAPFDHFCFLSSPISKSGYGAKYDHHSRHDHSRPREEAGPRGNPNGFARPNSVRFYQFELSQASCLARPRSADAGFLLGLARGSAQLQWLRHPDCAELVPPPIGFPCAIKPRHLSLIHI